jgi:hypothetical protein
MQGIAGFSFCGTLRLPPIQNFGYPGQGTADMVVSNITKRNLHILELFLAIVIVDLVK